MPPHQIENDYWQDGLHSSLHRLSALYNLSKLSDLTISFPNCMESLKVHRLILAMSSPVFEAMFYGPMAVKGDLILPEDPPQAFTILVSYIYENQVPLRDVDTAVKVYHLASKYQMNHLSSLCSQVVEDFSIEILSSPWLGQLTQQCMKDLLQQKLCADEVSVFKGLLQWGKNLSRFTRSHKGLRQQIETLLPHVRFLTMTSEDFERHVMPLNILTSDEKYAILKNLKQDGSVSLPAICSPERVKRIFYSIHQHHHVALRSGDCVYDVPYKITPNDALWNINKSEEERAKDEEDFDSEYNDCDCEVYDCDCYMEEEFSENSDFSYESDEGSHDSMKKHSSALENLENKSLEPDYIEEHVDLDNLIMIYELSFLFEDSKLKEKCRKVVEDFSIEILSSPWLGQLTQQCMKDLLQQKLCADEVSVFKGLMQWGASQSNNLSRFTRSHKGLRQHIETLLPHVRFLTMTSEDFERHVMPLNILTSDEKNAILKNLKQDGSVSLPAICSPEQEKRIFYSKHQHHHVALSVGNWVYDDPFKIAPNKAIGNINQRKEETVESDEDDRMSKDHDSYCKHGCCERYMEEDSYDSDESNFDSDEVNDSDESKESHDSIKTVTIRTTELLSSLKINKDIHVGLIKWTCRDFQVYRVWNTYWKIQLVIKSSSGNTVGEANINRMVYDVAFLFTFESPLVLSSSDVYSLSLVWPDNNTYSSLLSKILLNSQDEFHVSYGDLKMRGVIINCMQSELSIEFWCFSKLF
ncbi:uncharacterized protein [Palaemon carinicauda]|uniref:uncharacterized protein isoform X2 n=1 Tax=Palaemon carinicauda TaxID=392227 RepID=UPI0035B5A12A